MRNLLFGLLLLFLSPLLRAQTPAVITFDQGQITVLRDKTKQLTLEQARSAHAEGQFRPLKGNLGLGFVPDAAWLKVELEQVASVGLFLGSLRQAVATAPFVYPSIWADVKKTDVVEVRRYHLQPTG